MIDVNTIKNEYFEWLYNIVCEGRYDNRVTYRKLLTFLHQTEFKWIMLMDDNRANDGEQLRYRFGLAKRYTKRQTDCLYDHPCSVLEMMVALAIRCEESIMDDPKYGDRTAQWFWNMIHSLGVGTMIDSHFDKDYVSVTIERFMNREYEPNGKGGLFTIRRCDRDLRDVEIWYQLCWYLESITGY